MSIADELEKLVNLRDKDAFTEEEFQGQKSKILNRIRSNNPIAEIGNNLTNDKNLPPESDNSIIDETLSTDNSEKIDKVVDNILYIGLFAIVVFSAVVFYKKNINSQDKTSMMERVNDTSTNVSLKNHTNNRIENSGSDSKVTASTEVTSHNLSDSKDEYEYIGLALIKDPVRFSAICDRLEDVEVIEKIKKSAGMLNYPVYIIGYKFNCLSRFTGNKRITLYVSWMEDIDRGGAQCIFHGPDKNFILTRDWSTCGGLN